MNNVLSHIPNQIKTQGDLLCLYGQPHTHTHTQTSSLRQYANTRDDERTRVSSFMFHHEVSQPHTHALRPPAAMDNVFLFENRQVCLYWKEGPIRWRKSSILIKDVLVMDCQVLFGMTYVVG